MSPSGRKDNLCAFNVSCVREAADTILRLAETLDGAETVEVRQGEYKRWDPEVFRVDKAAEDAIILRLQEWGEPVVLLSEEAGRVEIHHRPGVPTRYAVADPLDGSFLFRQGLRHYWYSALAYYAQDFTPLTCAVADVTEGRVGFADASGAYVTTWDERRAGDPVRLGREYRASHGRPEVTSFEKAAISSYGMKPEKFLLPLVDDWRELLRPFRFYLPNGGPSGFWNVAEGKVDVYFALQQPFVDVFSGILIGLQGETVVSDFDGNPVRCDDDYRTLRNVVCSSNPKLHEKVLEAIADCRRKRRTVR